MGFGEPVDTAEGRPAKRPAFRVSGQRCRVSADRRTLEKSWLQLLDIEISNSFEEMIWGFGSLQCIRTQVLGFQRLNSGSKWLSYILSK